MPLAAAWIPAAHTGELITQDAFQLLLEFHEWAEVTLEIAEMRQHASLSIGAGQAGRTVRGYPVGVILLAIRQSRP